MKQHITYEQLHSLKPESYKKLRNYVFNKMTEKAEENYPGRYVTIAPPTDVDLKLSIGQMITFLDEQEGFLLNITRQVSSKNEKLKKPKWGVFNLFTNDKYFKLELADTLWQAVKEVLEN